MNQEPSAATKSPAEVGPGVRRWVIAVGVALLLQGTWGFFLPEGFYNDFPVAGAAWVSSLGEFNDHLMRDFGAAQIGLGLAAVIVARQRNLGGIIAMMAAYVVFGILHFGYHLTTLDHFETGSSVSQAIALATFIIIPAGVLLRLRRGTNTSGQAR